MNRDKTKKGKRAVRLVVQDKEQIEKIIEVFVLSSSYWFLQNSEIGHTKPLAPLFDNQPTNRFKILAGRRHN